MGVKFEFNCSVCGEKVLDTRFTEIPDAKTLAASPELLMCTKHESSYKQLANRDTTELNELKAMSAELKDIVALVEEKQSDAELVQEVSELIEEEGDAFFDPQGV